MTVRLIFFPVYLKLINASRFNDDECNYSVEFPKSFHIIYSNELQLKCEHHGIHTTFLDLDVTVVDCIYECKLCDKRDNYPFFLFACQF